MIVMGWDIGGSNTKVCRVDGGQVVKAVSRPFEVKDAPDRLAALLQELAAEAAGDATCEAHAVTMTAELSRNFLTKREGVGHVLEAVRAALAPVPIYVFNVRGRLFPIDDPQLDMTTLASANWMATARLVAETHPDALLIDVGSTTTDIIPIVGGFPLPQFGRTDLARLGAGELVYTGALRTPVEAIAHEVAIEHMTYAVAAEGFATSGDVYVWLGDLSPEAYAGPTADGRPSDKPHAGNRLRRALCDDESMPGSALTVMARFLADAQVNRIAAAIGRVRARQPSIQRAVVVGLGAFVGTRAARVAGLEVEHLADGREEWASLCAPAAAVAVLLDREIAGGEQRADEAVPRRLFVESPSIECVVKVGGSLLAYPDVLRRVLRDVLKSSGTLVIPGGGVFADAVRDLNPDLRLGPGQTHWMAVLAMDQYAEVILRHLQFGIRVETLAQAREALRSGRIPVLAPSRWLRQADPLPHSWDVTSDSIAAWVAGQAGARKLVLIKAPGATGTLVDAYFERARPAGVDVHVVSAGDEDGLTTALDTRRV